MRLIIPTLLLASLAACTTPPPPPVPQVVYLPRPKPTFPAPTRAPICAKPAETVAFAMAALRMQLSVTELTCDARPQFNAFTAKFKKDVASNNDTLGAFFKRAYGSKGVSNQDQYETAQINQMSGAGQYYGDEFCKTAMPMYDQVLALNPGKDLADYAVAQKFDQVVAAEECIAPAPPPPKTPAKPKS
jgi:hypothetical protein